MEETTITILIVNSQCFQILKIWEYVISKLRVLKFEIEPSTVVGDVHSSHFAPDHKRQASYAMLVAMFPVEILEEIFGWLCAEIGSPSRSLALVCKQWKEILLNLPVLWNTIEIDADDCRKSLEAVYDRLKRQLHHAKNGMLNVILKNTFLPSKLSPEEFLDLFTTLPRLAPVERWYSLRIVEREYRWQRQPPHTDKVLVGDFKSLRILSIEGFDYSWFQHSAHLDLVARISQCKPQLHTLNYLSSSIPGKIEALFQLSTLKTFAGGFTALEEIPPAVRANLRKVTVDGRVWPNDIEQMSTIPSFTNSMTILNCPPHIFYWMDILNIESLRVERFYDWDGFKASIRLPNLRTLSVKPCLPQFLQVFKAPNVQSIELSGVKRYSQGVPMKIVRAETRALTLALFRTGWGLEMYPTSLTIGVEGLTDRTLVVMLERWSQLRHLTIVLGGDFDFFGLIANQLLSGTKPLCPQLETMYIEVWWYGRGRKWRKWREVAEKMMVRRRNLPLKNITWRNNRFDAESVVRDSTFSALT
ncbi:hypothetical protein FRC17_002718 [Serendipita sp. 399]|nr:hypothetical protein FRC17_002718 [Serendipita sp. 399]